MLCAGKPVAAVRRLENPLEELAKLLGKRRHVAPAELDDTLVESLPLVLRFLINDLKTGDSTEIKERPAR
jgi:hypothetical protein